jgi:hypothetical protein
MKAILAISALALTSACVWTAPIQGGKIGQFSLNEERVNQMILQEVTTIDNRLRQPKTVIRHRDTVTKYTENGHPYQVGDVNSPLVEKPAVICYPEHLEGMPTVCN